MKILELKLADVEPDHDQPRKTFPKDAQDELETSIARWGQLQPIRVRKDADGAFVIVDGERRYRALSALGKKLPDDARFRSVRAFEDDVDTSEDRARKAI